MRTACALLVAAAGLVAGRAAAATDLPDSGEFACQRSATGDCDYRDPSIGLQFRWPTDWPIRRLKIVTETGPAARARQRDAIRWLAFEYVPDDDTQPEASLFRIAVLRRSDWLLLSAGSMLVEGVEVATDREYVAIANLPPANPYPPGSRDADIFDALLPGYAGISRIVHFLPRQ